MTPSFRRVSDGFPKTPLGFYGHRRLACEGYNLRKRALFPGIMPHPSCRGIFREYFRRSEAVLFSVRGNPQMDGFSFLVSRLINLLRLSRELEDGLIHENQSHGNLRREPSIPSGFVHTLLASFKSHPKKEVFHIQKKTSEGQSGVPAQPFGSICFPIAELWNSPLAWDSLMCVHSK